MLFRSLLDIKLEDTIITIGSSQFMTVLPIPSYATIDNIDEAYWESDSDCIEIATYEGEIIGDYEGEAIVTVTIGSMNATCVVTVVSASHTPQTVTFDATAQGYINQQEVSSWSDEDITITFDKGTNSNAPKFYDNGNSLRVYGGNTIAVATSSGVIKTITFTFGSSDGSNDITVVKGTFVSPTWVGEESGLTFFIEGTSGNRRIVRMEITYIPA